MSKKKNKRKAGMFDGLEGKCAKFHMDSYTLKSTRGVVASVIYSKTGLPKWFVMQGGHFLKAANVDMVERLPAKECEKDDNE